MLCKLIHITNHTSTKASAAKERATPTPTPTPKAKGDLVQSGNHRETQHLSPLLSPSPSLFHSRSGPPRPSQSSKKGFPPNSSNPMLPYLSNMMHHHHHHKPPLQTPIMTSTPPQMTLTSTKSTSVIERYGQISPVSDSCSSASPGTFPEKRLATFKAAAMDATAATEKDLFPSLCEQVEEPEPHPDFQIIMASLGLRGKSVKGDSLQQATLPLNQKAQSRAGQVVGNSIQHRSYRSVPPPPLRISTQALANPLSLPHSSTPTVPSSSSFTVKAQSLPPTIPQRRKSNAEGAIVTTNRRPTQFEVQSCRPASVYATAQYNVTVARYVTNADPRGFLPGR